jgi:hypothetical protein
MGYSALSGFAQPGKMLVDGASLLIGVPAFLGGAYLTSMEIYHDIRGGD